MSVTVRFTDDKLGRKQGSTEVVYDETLARVWIDACMAEAVGSVARSVDQPPADRAIGSPPVQG